MVKKSTIIPHGIPANPAPLLTHLGVTQERVKTELVESILAVFHELLPSNYVSEVRGPHYTLQYQAAAEALADLQIAVQEVFADSVFDLTRPEFLFQLLGSLVFPDGERRGVPLVDGDVSFRSFLHKILLLLLEGSTLATVEGGARAVYGDDAIITVREPGLTPGSDPSDRFRFEVEVTYPNGTISPFRQFNLNEDLPGDLELDEGELLEVPYDTFPPDMAQSLRNAHLVIGALKPAHTLFDIRHVFREFFGIIFTEQSYTALTQYEYEDFRKYCRGRSALYGSAGETLVRRNLFRDNSLDFRAVQPFYSMLLILDGENADVLCRVMAVQHVLVPTATAPATFTWGAVSGIGTLQDGHIWTSEGVDFSAAVEGDILSISTGVNAGAYRVAGGEMGALYLAPSVLKLDKRMGVVATGQVYRVSLDLKGSQEDHVVTSEDVSSQFYI